MPPSVGGTSSSRPQGSGRVSESNSRSGRKKDRVKREVRNEVRSSCCFYLFSFYCCTAAVSTRLLSALKCHREGVFSVASEHSSANTQTNKHEARTKRHLRQPYVRTWFSYMQCTYLRPTPLKTLLG
ncbi:unnamed protein product [Pylaiella littoralis]